MCRGETTPSHGECTKDVGLIFPCHQRRSHSSRNLNLTIVSKNELRALSCSAFLYRVSTDKEYRGKLLSPNPCRKTHSTAKFVVGRKSRPLSSHLQIWAKRWNHGVGVYSSTTRRKRVLFICGHPVQAKKRKKKISNPPSEFFFIFAGPFFSTEAYCIVLYGVLACTECNSKRTSARRKRTLLEKLLEIFCLWHFLRATLLKHFWRYSGKQEGGNFFVEPAKLPNSKLESDF